jgi:hypothetical protein
MTCGSNANPQGLLAASKTFRRRGVKKAPAYSLWEAKRTWRFKAALRIREGGPAPGLIPAAIRSRSAESILFFPPSGKLW